MFCINCGKKLLDNANYCSYCGKAVDDIDKMMSNQTSKENTLTGNNENNRRKSELLNVNSFIIDEKITAFRFTESYKIYNDSGKIIGAIQQANISGSAKAARIFLGSRKSLQSIQYDITDENANVVAVLKKDGISAGFSKLNTIEILDGDKRRIGILKNGILLDTEDNQVGTIHHNLFPTLNYTLKDISGEDLAVITKKWNGIGKELFTTADKYHVEMFGNLTQERRVLVLASAIMIDMFFFEV